MGRDPRGVVARVGGGGYNEGEVAAWVGEERRRRWRRERGEGDARETERRGIGKPLGYSFFIIMIIVPLYL